MLTIVINRGTETLHLGAFAYANRVDPASARINLSTMACKKLRVSAGGRVQFTIIGEEWFISKTESEEGYGLIGNDYGLMLHAGMLVNELFDCLAPIRKRLWLKVQPTKHELNGQPLFQLIPTRQKTN